MPCGWSFDNKKKKCYLNQHLVDSETKNKTIWQNISWLYEGLENQKQLISWNREGRGERFKYINELLSSVSCPPPDTLSPVQRLTISPIPPAHVPLSVHTTPDTLHTTGFTTNNSGPGHSTLYHSIPDHSTLDYSTLQCSISQYSKSEYSISQYSISQYITVL